MKKVDKVKVQGMGRGIVTRVAKDNSWVEIDFGVATKQVPVNLNDCMLLMQMGYRVEIKDGRVRAVVKESKKRTA
jgi:hypothetical protein